MNFKEYRKELIKKNGFIKDEINYIFCEVLKTDLTNLTLIEKINFFDGIKVEYVISKRKKGIPLTKIFKSAYFYGNKFKVNNNVLSPRQETEVLVENALKHIKDSNSVLDLCTGSGIIAISIQKNSRAKVVASDISSKALKVAKFNAKKLNADINFIQSDLFENIIGKFDVIVSNPPYIKTSVIEKLDIEVKKYDPIISLDGGEDGLDFYKKIVKQAKKHLNKNGKILFEIGFDQANEVKELLEKENFKVKLIKDYSGNDRVLIGELKDAR